MEASTMRQRLIEARVGRLATVRADGRPHLVPCCYALAGDTVYSAVDAKPKTTQALRRLANLRANSEACLLVDHYGEDWSALWWIRVDGHGRVIESGPERMRAIDALTTKYEQYRHAVPDGPVVAIDLVRWVGWP